MSINFVNKLLFALWIFVLGVVVVFFYNAYKQLDTVQESLNKIVTLNVKIHDMQVLSNEAILFPRENTTKNWNKNYNNVKLILDNLLATPNRKIIRKQINDIATIHKEILSIYKEYEEVLKQSNVTKSFKQLKASHLFSLSTQLNRMVFNLKVNELKYLSLIHQEIKIYIIVILFLIFLFIVGNFLFTVKKILKPLEVIRKQIEKSKNIIDLEKINYSADDEIGLIIKTLNKSITSAKKWKQKERQYKEELENNNVILSNTNRELEESEYEIQLINENLEEKIKEKTLKLTQLNENLQEEVEKKTQENFKQFQTLQNQSKLASMGEMVGAIAHQWRQPLNEIGIRIQKLRYSYNNGKIDKEYIEDFIEKNKETIHFMSKTIDDFRNFFRLDKEKIVFSIEESIQNVLNIQDALLKTYNIQVEVRGEDFQVNGLKTEFQQVIINLINNAKDVLIEKKVESPLIHIVLDHGKLSIEDNGGGIDEYTINRIFEPYFTTKEQGLGTGMGLYLCKMIIEDNMDGTLNVENTQNGAIFTISFKQKDIYEKN